MRGSPGGNGVQQGKGAVGRSHASWRRGAISKMIPLVPSYRGEREIDAPGLSRCLGRHSAARTAARLGLLVLLVALAGTAAAVSVEAGGGPLCAKRKADAAYMDGVNETLAAHQDVWGNELLRSPDGPTYAGVRRYLHPLMLVGRPAGLGPSRLTDSGVYYLPFGVPSGSNGASRVQLHVADGSQIVSRLASGSRLSLDVGASGHERYGSCLARLAQPHLRGGYLPILETSYVDADGVRYRQESFATRLPRTRALVSFVRLHIDPRRSEVRRAYVRFTPSGGLGRGARARLVFSPGGTLRRSSLVYATKRQEAAHGLRGLARSARATSTVPAWERDLQAGEADGEHVLGAPRRRRGDVPGPREAGHERRAQPPDPEHAHVVALQPRQFL